MHALCLAHTYRASHKGEDLWLLIRWRHHVLFWQLCFWCRSDICLLVGFVVNMICLCINLGPNLYIQDWFHLVSAYGFRSLFWYKSQVQLGVTWSFSHWFHLWHCRCRSAAEKPQFSSVSPPFSSDRHSPLWHTLTCLCCKLPPSVMCANVGYLRTAW